jgi:nicotinate-nucleotide pyrophosphorylase (carboxylating)
MKKKKKINLYKKRKKFWKIFNELVSKTYLTHLIESSLNEDIGKGDITTSSLSLKNDVYSAYIIAKEECIIAGIFLVEKIFKKLYKKTKIRIYYYDGEKVKKGTKIAQIVAPIDVLLKGERVALNFLQHLSGIATLCSKFVKVAKNIKILDTRKTIPLLRPIQKYAVRVGGGFNHRMGLYDAILIKDNHIKAYGSISEAIRKAKRKNKKVEIEVKNINEIKQALTANPDILLFDNFSIKNIKKGIELVKNKAKIEVSGNITLNKVKKLAKLKIDAISIGALTHSAHAIDISMKIDKKIN